jgi:hypothetical protein
MYRKLGLLPVLFVLIGGTLQADFSFEEITKVTGGSLLKMTKWMPGGGKMTEPITGGVYVKGNRMAQVNDSRITITDLDKETITEIDMKAKTYSVVTFAEMAQMMEALQKKMSQMQADPRAQQAQDPNVKFDMKVDVKETGATRNISGLDTKEIVLKITMEAQGVAQNQGQATPVAMNTDVISDMWMTETIPGYEEVQEFYRRAAAKMAISTGMNPMFATRPGMGQGVKKLAEESAKLKGTPVMQVTKITGMGIGMPGMPAPDMSKAGSAASEQAGRDAESAAMRQAGRASGGRFGGLVGSAAGGMLGGMSKKKKEEPKQEAPAEAQPAAQQQPQMKEEVLIETTSEKRNFSKTAIAANRFDVPAGFKQVDNEMKKSLDKMQ